MKKYSILIVFIIIVFWSCQLPDDLPDVPEEGNNNDGTISLFDNEEIDYSPDSRFTGLWKSAVFFQDSLLSGIDSNYDYLSISSNNNILIEYSIHDRPEYNNSDSPLKYIWGIENNQFFKRLYTVESAERDYYDFSFIDSNHLVLSTDSTSKHYFLEIPTLPELSVKSYEYHQSLSNIICTGIIQNTGEYSAQCQIDGTFKDFVANPIYQESSIFSISGNSESNFTIYFSEADINNVSLISFNVFFTYAFSE